MKYEQCIQFGHHWSSYNPKRGEWPDNLWPATTRVEHARCEGCGGTRRFQLEVNGYTLARSYRMPEDYGWRGPAGDKPTRSELKAMIRVKRVKAVA